MYIFFFIINIIFSLIFFSFWKNIESVFFLIIGFIMFFYFNPFILWKKEDKNIILNKIKINKKDIKKIVFYIQKSFYIISFWFFYIALYGISYSIWWYLFQIFTFIISLILLIIFFYTLKKQVNIIKLLFRSHFLVFSFLYLIFFLFYIIYPNTEKINYIFIINSIFSLIWLWSIILFDFNYPIEKKWPTYIFFLIYLFIFLLFYINHFFEIELYIIFSYLWIISSVLYFEYLPKIKYFKQFDILSKYTWIILNYITLICLFIYLFIISWWSFNIILLLLIWIILNYIVHYKYENYISLFLSIFTIVLFYIKIFLWIEIINFIGYIIFIYFLPFILIFYTYIFEIKYIYDIYYFHYIGIILSLFLVIYYFIQTRDINILNISILILLQSWLLFSSFVKFKGKEKIL